MKKGCAKKYFKWFGISLGSVLIIGLIYIGVVWGNKIVTLYSLKQINKVNKNYPFYTMNYKGDYAFDDYLKVGSKNYTEYSKFISKKVLNGLDKVLKTTPPKCSSFTATTPNGDKLFARNLDTGMAIPLFLKTNPSNGYKSMSMVNLLFMGYYIKKHPLPISKTSIFALISPYLPYEGMNEHGLAISSLTAGGCEAKIKKGKVTLNDFSLMRMVLDKASTVKEAVKMIKNYNISFVSTQYPSHFMVADATGASVVVEYVGGDLHFVYSSKPYNIVTNFILYHNQLGGFGFDRYTNIECKLEDVKGILTEKQAMKLLSENTIPGDEQWSAVYNLTQKKAYICVGKDYKTVYKFGLN